MQFFIALALLTAIAAVYLLMQFVRGDLTEPEDATTQADAEPPATLPRAA
jgi:hypothetical protein